MSINISVNNQANYGSVNITENRTISGEGEFSRRITVPGAKPGELTTRTDAETGTLTMEAGHGITSGDVIDLYWTNTDGSKGVRRGITVGTVSVNSVPIGADNSGTDDDLPPQGTDIYAMIPVEELLPSPAANSYKFLGVSIPVPGKIDFEDGDSVLLSKLFPKETGGAYQWNADNGEVNPMENETPTKLVLSHGDASPQTVQVLILWD